MTPAATNSNSGHFSGFAADDAYTRLSDVVFESSFTTSSASAKKKSIMPIYLVRLAQAHESFRKVELQALADLAGVEIEFVKYEEDVSHCVGSGTHLFAKCTIFSLGDEDKVKNLAL